MGNDQLKYVEFLLFGLDWLIFVIFTEVKECLKWYGSVLIVVVFFFSEIYILFCLDCNCEINGDSEEDSDGDLVGDNNGGGVMEGKE